MAERMTFVLDGRDNLSTTLDRAGDSADRLDRRITGAMNHSNQAVGRFTRDSQGRLHDARGHFLSTGEATRVMAAHAAQLAPALTRVASATTVVNNQLGTLSNYTRDANGRLRDARGRFLGAGDGANTADGAVGGLASRLRSLVGAGDGASESLGKGGGLSGSMGIVAAIAALSLLPALGALIPMLAGLGLLAGTVKLGFKGVGEAVALATTDKKEYAKALKKLPAPAREFTKALVGVKKEFSELAGPIQKAMLPGFTKAAREAGPVVDILGKGMTELGGGLGDAAAGASRLMKDSGFQKDFGQTLKLGNVFVKDLTSSMGPFVRALVDFGAASGPTLRSFSSGISGLLGKGGGGLAGFFDGLKTGVGGASALLDGLFGAVNRVLPAFGRLSGSVADAFGPLLGELADFGGKAVSVLMDGLGGAAKWLSPVFHDLAFGVKAVTTVLGLIGPTVKDMAAAIFGSFMPAFSEVDKAKGPLQSLLDNVNENKGAIQEFARSFSSGVIDIAGSVISNLPGMLGIFRMVTGGMVSSLGGVLHAAAATFGWIPGIGGKLKSADQAFASFKDSYVSGLKSAEASTREFAEGALPKLQAGRLQMNINNWESQIATAKGQLKSVPASKRADLLARINDLQQKAAAARGELQTIKSKTVDIRARDAASATARAIQAAIARIQGKTVTVHTINMTSTVARNNANYRAKGGPIHRAAGGPVGFPGGGHVRGPGTETSDSIATFLSDNEYVIKAKSVAKYGLPMLDALNDGRLEMAAAGPSGGAMSSAGRDAGRGLASGLRSSLAPVEKASRAMAAAVESGIRAELEIASPSRKTKALADDTGKGFVAGLTGSKARIAAMAKDLVADIWKAWKGTKSTKDSQLVAMVNRDTAKLQALATKRDVVAAKIKAAKAYEKEIRDNARQGAGLSSLGLQPEEVTAGSIKGGLAAKLAEIKTFSSRIYALSKKGLNKGLLRQILNMGPEAGGAYASALMGADKATFASINKLQSDLDASTATLGRVGADALYDAGKNSGKGFLAGLAGEQKAIEAQMVKIAKGMEKAIKKALGINSPARVMMPHGENATKGVGVGALAGIPFLDRAMNTVAGRVSSVRPVMGAAVLPSAAMATTGTHVTCLHITIPGLVVDPVATARMIDTLQTKYGRYTGTGGRP
ncbi:hypothetical protein [Streptomyces sp. SID3212]|uniref:hypothetical protein n=1 Tax=Streptomyces sp. SID3212 TaxID=2690259 RepID=UPI00137001B7|nr:hypothetical protein [Streptomyces sp. SID3212]MYV56502.1 hypothetical protein [Streptomyces sp. SID3212]